MCSVGFILAPGLGQSKLTTAIEKVVAAGHHRGPDDQNTYLRHSAAFGFNRLSIVGGPAGRQPITDPDSGVTIVCNGEIFNHTALRRDYVSSATWQTSSDVEVILHLYNRYGTDCVKYLEGQFAFVILDPNRGRVVMARDRFGINPLFYSLHQGRLVVASEIKSIIASGIAAPPSLDPVGIGEGLLLYGPRPPRTCFTGISQVAPATVCVYDMASQSLSCHEYWSVAHVSPGIPGMPDDAAVNVESSLVASVKRRLQGDSRVGVYVSGGLDSSVIAAITANLVPADQIELFSIAFDDGRYDESPFQRQLADSLGLPLTQITVQPTDIAEHLEKALYHVENPLIRSAPVPMMLLSEAVRQKGVKFVLCGEGADELFAGYPVFLERRSSYEHKYPQLSQYVDIFRHSVAEPVASSMRDLGLLSEERGWLTRSRHQEIATKLSQYLLVSQGDRVSMAHGVEQRFPFLDTSVAHLALGFGEDRLIEDGVGKAVIRRAFAGYLPAELVQRRKQGYLAPDDQVVRLLLAQPAYARLLNQETFDEVGIFDYSAAAPILAEATMGGINSFAPNMALYMLTTHMLHDRFIRNTAAKPA